MEGESSNTSLCFLIGVETTFYSVIDLYLLRNTIVSESIRQLKGVNFHLASSHVQPIVVCLTVKSVESNWEMQMSLWHLEEWTGIFFSFFSWTDSFLLLNNKIFPFNPSAIHPLEIMYINLYFLSSVSSNFFFFFFFELWLLKSSFS